MNRRELLREMSRVQATWVNRNTPGTGDVNIAAEDEQDYLTRIAAVFERAREDVRRKRGRPVTASQASAAIGAMLLAFDPNQRRDPDGKWGDGVPGSPTLSRKDDPLGLSDRIRLKSGETLRGSDRVRAEGGDGDALLAAIAGPDGPQLRFGVIPSWDAKKWAASDRGATARFDGADVDRVATELAAVSDAAKKAQVDFRTLGKQLDDEGVWWDDDANLTPDQIDRRTAYEALRDDGVFTEGVIPGSGWGDIHWTIRGDDVGESGNEEVLVSFLVRPSGERDMSWDEMRDGAADSWSPAIYGVSGAARLSRSAAKMATASQSAVTAAASMAFDPDQPRDREGKWTDGPLGASGVDLGAWQAQEASSDLPVDTAELFRLGSAIAKVMNRDGVTMNDPIAFFGAATEALAGSDATPRQYVAALDRQYGTGMADSIEAALRERDSASAPPEPPSAGPRLPDFGASYADRVSAMEVASIDAPRASMKLSGGTLAEVTRFDWQDRSRSVVKNALSSAGNIDPRTQTDAEELTSRVADVLRVRAPAVRRMGATEVEMEYMPGKPGAEVYGAIAPDSIVDDPENANIGLLDYITNNADRHPGNWTVDDDGNVYAIDHGLAFQSNIGILAYGPFALAHGFSIGKPKNVDRAELDRIRGELGGLRSNFDALGRADWFDGMMTRLDNVVARLEA